MTVDQVGGILHQLTRIADAAEAFAVMFMIYFAATVILKILSK